MRAVSQEWRRGSLIAVDAGVHLSAITRLLEQSLPYQLPNLPFTLSSGPFAGLSLPYKTAGANAAHITRHLVDTYLITHPHLDHISGFVVNTAGFPGSKPKKLAGLPSTIQAFKTHIFNNVIWPNLSDENNGAGLVTYLRLVEGGSPALGDGEGRGYSEVCDGLLVKSWSVSHGHCLERHSHRGSIACPRGSVSGPASRGNSNDPSPQTRRNSQFGVVQPPSRTSSLVSQAALNLSAPTGEQERMCVYDSCAYFIQEQTQRREVLIFGDVEPDSISLSPRNEKVWQEAAPKIASGNLVAIFIECSYDDSQSDDRLFGHLKPEYVIEELLVLARAVQIARRLRQLEGKKRKRLDNADEPPRRNPSYGSMGTEDPVSPRTTKVQPPPSQPQPPPPDMSPGSTSSTPHIATPTGQLSLVEQESPAEAGSGQRQLEGLKVVIIHVKEKLDDEPDVRQIILKQLQDYEEIYQLGCEFVVSEPGQSFYF